MKTYLYGISAMALTLVVLALVSFGVSANETADGPVKKQLRDGSCGCGADAPCGGNCEGGCDKGNCPNLGAKAAGGCGCDGSAECQGNCGGGCGGGCQGGRGSCGQ